MESKIKLENEPRTVQGKLEEINTRNLSLEQFIAILKDENSQFFTENEILHEAILLIINRS